MSNFKWKIFSNFVAFSEYPNFTEHFCSFAKAFYFWWCFFIFLLAKQIQNLSFCTLLLHILCQTIVAVALAMIKTGHLCNSSGHARWPNKDTGAVVAFPYTDWLLAAAAMARRRRLGLLHRHAWAR